MSRRGEEWWEGGREGGREGERDGGREEGGGSEGGMDGREEGKRKIIKEERTLIFSLSLDWPCIC